MSIQSLALVDSTLREGEQFAHAHFSTGEKLQIVAALDEFGVEYIELTSPAASPQAEADVRAVVAARPRARVLTHTRCDLKDVDRALATGVDGVNVLFATSQVLRQAGHRRSLDEVVDIACQVVEHVRAEGRQIRFSCEDSFRSQPADLLRIYRAVDACDPDRVGIADTVGVATPGRVEELTRLVRDNVKSDIEFHGHNDTGCAIANAAAALEGGATHVDVTVLGIGERNGIASLAGMVARLSTLAPGLLEGYRLDMLPRIDALVASTIGIPVPFNSPITGAGAFSHKAGLHSNAVLRDPRSYEILTPEDFGRSREILRGHRLVGRNAIRERALALGVSLDEEQSRVLTAKVKQRADHGPLDDSQVDALLLAWTTPPLEST